MSIKSSNFNFDSESITNFSKDTKFPGMSQTLNSNDKTDEESSEKVLTREEIREARLKAFSKYN